jgi:MFS transporter, NNP family, nitrate/nitrite transporter
MSETTTASTRVLWLSTTGFTLMFAVWLMFGILGKPIQQEFGLTEVELSWIVAAAALNGSLWRLPTGMVTDRIGGRKVMTFLLAATAVPAFLVSRADSYAMVLVLAFFVGFGGNSFAAGIAWNSAWQPRERQGFALGLFGAGNVGASVTKFIGPPLIAGTAGASYFGVIAGGWRLVPVVYAALLLVMAALTWFGTPSQDRAPGTGQPLRQQVRPLRSMRVWRFSLYYVSVFGAYVALAAWLPTYYMDNFAVSLQTAALLTATYIFPASLLRPYGGHLSDRLGARRVMYWTFGTMLVVTGILMMPNGHIVISHPDGTQSEHLAYSIGLVPFAVLVFVLQAHPGVLPRQRRRRRGAGRDARRPRWILPPTAVRLHQGVVRVPLEHVLRPVRPDPRVRRVDALDRRPHAAHRVPGARPPPGEPVRRPPTSGRAGFRADCLRRHAP